MQLKRRNEDSLDKINIKKQHTVERWGSGSSIVSQNTLDNAIMEFVIDDLQPLSVVDSPAFINLVRKGLPSSIRIMCRKTLKERLDKKYYEMKAVLDTKLINVEIVSTTADLWSKMKRCVI